MSAADDPVLARLEVPRVVLLEELMRMGKVLGRSRSGEALLMYDVGRLQIRIGGAECAIPASGHWPGEARVSALWLRAFVKVPPAQDPVVFQVQGGRMRISTSTIPCRWQVPGAATIEAPLGNDLLALLRLSLEHSDAELEKSGLGRSVADARAELDRRIKAAARQLAPLGVSESDVRVLVTGKFNLGE